MKIKYKINTNEFRKGFRWEIEEKHKAVKHLLENVLKYSKEDIEKNINHKFFREYGLESLLRTYKNGKLLKYSPYDMIRDTYPNEIFYFINERKNAGFFRKEKELTCEKCGVTNDKIRIYESTEMQAVLCRRCYGVLWSLINGKRKTRILLDEDARICRICGKEFNQVTTHVYQMHGLRKEEYIEKYNVKSKIRDLTLKEAKIKIGLIKNSPEKDEQMQMDIDVEKETVKNEQENEIVENKQEKEVKTISIPLKVRVEKYKLEPFKNLLKTRNSAFLLKYMEMIQAEIDKDINVDENKTRLELIDKELNKKFKKESK